MENGITGRNPTAPGTLADLRILDLRSNEFIGPIPSDREFNQEYSDGIRRAVELLQWWYAEHSAEPTSGRTSSTWRFR